MLAILFSPVNILSLLNQYSFPALRDLRLPERVHRTGEEIFIRLCQILLLQLDETVQAQEISRWHRYQVHQMEVMVLLRVLATVANHQAMQMELNKALFKFFGELMFVDRKSPAYKVLNQGQVTMAEAMSLFKTFLAQFKIKYRRAYDEERGIPAPTSAAFEDPEQLLYEH